MTVSAIGFEGFEKRLEISFFEPNVFLDPEGKGLHVLTKSHLDAVSTIHVTPEEGFSYASFETVWV